MEKKLVSSQYIKRYDESQIVKRKYRERKVVYLGRHYTDVTDFFLESESYQIDHMSPKEVFENSIAMLFF